VGWFTALPANIGLAYKIACHGQKNTSFCPVVSDEEIFMTLTPVVNAVKLLSSLLMLRVGRLESSFLAAVSV